MSEQTAKALSRQEILEKMKMVENKNRLDEHNMMLYVLTPYLATLGYKVFNIDDVETDVEAHTIKVKVSNDFSTMVGLTNLYPYGEDDTNVFLYVDMENKELSLSMKALGEWEVLHSVSLEEESKEADDTYKKIVEFLEVTSVQNMYKSKKARMFTEGVLRAKLIRKEYDNSFVRAIIREELKQPSKQLLNVIATGLNHKFSSDSVTNLSHGLGDMTGQEFMDIIVNVAEELSREEYDGYSRKHKQLQGIEDTEISKENVVQLQTKEKDMNKIADTFTPEMSENNQDAEDNEFIYDSNDEVTGKEDFEPKIIFDSINEDDDEEPTVMFDIVEEDNDEPTELVFDVVGNNEDDGEEETIFDIPAKNKGVDALEHLFDTD